MVEDLEAKLWEIERARGKRLGEKVEMEGIGREAKFIDVFGNILRLLFLSIAEQWETYWKDKVGFYDFLSDYVEIDDRTRTYVVRKRKKKPEPP